MEAFAGVGMLANVKVFSDAKMHGIVQLVANTKMLDSVKIFAI